MLPRGSCLWGNLVAYLLMIKQPVLIQILVARSTLQLAGCSYLFRHARLRLYLLYQATGVLTRRKKALSTDGHRPRPYTHAKPACREDLEGDPWYSGYSRVTGNRKGKTPITLIRIDGL